MFYEVKVPDPGSGKKKIAALVVLNPADRRNSRSVPRPITPAMP